MIVSKTTHYTPHTYTPHTHSTHSETVMSTKENLKIENKNKNHIKNFWHLCTRGKKNKYK